MKTQSEFDEIRQDFEARQRNILPGDPFRKSLGYDGRIVPGPLLMAVLFLILGAGISAVPFIKNFEDGTTVAFPVAFGTLFVAYKLFRNALHRH